MKVLPLFPSRLFVREDCGLDLKELKEKCLEHQSVQPTVNFSNVGGYQGEDFEYEPLNKLISNTLTNISDPKRPLKRFQISSWVNINPPGSYNQVHIHGAYKFFLTGVFYVQTPTNSGDICFRDPRGPIGECCLDEIYFSNGKAEIAKIGPEPNTLLLFPTWLPHYVERNDSEEDRISISFNIFNVEY